MNKASFIAGMGHRRVTQNRSYYPFLIPFMQIRMHGQTENLVGSLFTPGEIARPVAQMAKSTLEV